MPEVGEAVDQVQTEVAQTVAEPGTEAPQVTEPTAEVQPEAVTEPQKPEAAKPEKTYTEKERREWEAAKDKDIAAHRQALAQAAMELQVRDLRHAEELAQARDATAVDNGQITEEEAAQRRQDRIAAIQKQFAERQTAQQNEAAMQQRMTAAQAVLSRAEEAGRILAATDLAKAHGIDAKELLGDTSLTDYDKMESKALKLALRAAKAKPEKFDSGQTAGIAEASEQQILDQRYPTMRKK